MAKELVACVSSSPLTSSWICDLWLHAFVTLLGNVVVQSVHNVEHFGCYVVDSFLSNVENADVPCCTQHRGAGTQEAGRAALQAQAGAGANERPMQPSIEPRKSPQHHKVQNSPGA